MNVGGNNAGDFPHATQGYQLFANQSMEISIRNADNGVSMGSNKWSES